MYFVLTSLFQVSRPRPTIDSKPNFCLPHLPGVPIGSQAKQAAGKPCRAGEEIRAGDFKSTAMGSWDIDHVECQVKEAVPAEADAQVEANTGKTSEESAAAPAEEKVQYSSRGA